MAPTAVNPPAVPADPPGPARQCLVTGGAGFIGSHLVHRLLHDGHRVTVLDNLATGRLDNLAHLFDHPTLGPRLHFVQADAADLQAIRPHFADAQWVFHLAALADIVPSIQRPLDYHHANVHATVAVLEAARSAPGLLRFLYTASSSCYGLPDTFPTPESADPRPLYPYALTKWIGECYALHWHRVYQLPVVSLRLFNVYGPRSRTTGAYGAVFGVFLAQKLAQKPYTVVGDGRQSRDFTYVTDVADAFVRAAQAPADRAVGHIFNVGSGSTYSINTLVQLLGGPVTYIPKRPGEPDQTYADISRIRQQLGWQPAVSLREGVGHMLQHIHLWRDAPVWNERSIADATRDWFKHLTPPPGAIASAISAPPPTPDPLRTLTASTAHTPTREAPR